MSAAALSTRAGTSIAIGVALACASAAHAQRVMTNVTNWQFTPPLSTSTVSGQVFGVPPAATGSGGAALIRGQMRTTQNGDGTFDRIQENVGPLRYEFQLTANADIYVPILRNLSDIWTVAGNAGTVQYGYSAQLWQETGAGTGVFANTGLSLAALGSAVNGRAPGTYNTNATQYDMFANVAASNRRYQVRWSLTMEVNSFGGPPNAANNGANTSTTELRFNGPNQAFVASVAAVPAGYAGDSRAAVGAAQARAAFGVSGAGGGILAAPRVNVGVLEPGVSYTNHQTLLGRVTVLNNGGAAARTDEHTLAVTGIIAGDDVTYASSGIAPGARVASASIGDYGGTIAGAQAIVNHFGADQRIVINYSASDPNCTVQALDAFLTNYTNVTWVSAGGNEQLSGAWPGRAPRPPFLGNVETPEYAYAGITVGSMEGNFSVPSDFSSTTLGLQPQTPHIMAPGEYILSPLSRDTNNSGVVDDSGRTFLGDDWRFSGATTGRIAGTSFAAPHVAGAVALMHDYAQINFGRFDSTSCDHRVMKAILLTGANTTGIWDRNGNAWHQETSGGGYDGDPLLVHRSLDQNLGSGMLNIPTALRIMSGGEARTEDYVPANAPRNAQIHPSWTTANGAIWDYETVGAADGGINGTVDYFLPTNVFAGIFQNPSNETVEGVQLTPDFSWLRSCLTWDRTVTGATYDDLSNLQLRLYADRPNGVSNTPGFDPNNPGADILIALTDGAGENVRLLDMDTIHSFYELNDPAQVLTEWSFYLQVTNLTDSPTTYGIAISLIPTPSGAALLAVVGVYAGAAPSGLSRLFS